MEIGFRLYLVFMISWFLHLTSRLSFLGTLRFDLLMIAAITGLIVVYGSGRKRTTTLTGTMLFVLLGYAFVTLPFVEWPGSVIRYGLEDFAKAIVFYFFTVALVTSEKKLKVFLWVGRNSDV